MQENQISLLFWTFLLLTEEDMASCSRIRKPKSAEEERNLFENAILKSILAWQNGQWKFFWNGRMVGKTKIHQSSLCAFSTDKPKVQRLDTDIVNMTAKSLNFWLTKFVLKWIYCVKLVKITLNMHLQFVLSVACW